MSKLIIELKQEHQEITDILIELKKIGISSTKGIELLMQSKTALLAHLDKEGKQLYGILSLSFLVHKKKEEGEITGRRAPHLEGIRDLAL